MPNELLDFVLSLVRDPGVAAQYAADPNGALADAGLSGVTTADVSNLIPVVSESLPVADAGNVWASGAATAAFDAFDSFDVIDVVDAPVVDEPAIDTGPALEQPSYDHVDAGLAPPDPLPDPVIDAGAPPAADVFDAPVIDAPILDAPYDGPDPSHVDLF
ncbi:Rv0340 family protein [Mycobacterium sp. MYCO198283]|uniref:Rv0340 family IniB-related protein n=1 Tax=Mycobacterium sp. MYCO198283 TaxID=2883505 RepID=UPI001E58455D|nr:Rv0340 family IniB-related protein [Mycobacterium sp. MYCO198283]MCG5432110.1 Rv0340 family protein [Mycobacterium sp. MYCO198283]